MLRILGRTSKTCDGESRRELMRIGALSLFGGISLPRLLHANKQQQRRATKRDRASQPEGSAKAVILLNLFGGPAHTDMFDMKPEAPANVRGEFKPIDTSVPDLQISEHLPLTAKSMHRATLIRTHSHPYNSHNPYNVLTGFTGGNDRENYFAKRADHPSMGSVMQYAGIRSVDVPSYVFMPAFPGYSQSLRRSGPYGAYLGSQYDPLMTVCNPKFAKEADPNKTAYDPIPPIGDPLLPSLDELPGITADRLNRRKSLLEQVDEKLSRLDASRATDSMTDFQQEALSLLTSSKTRSAFDPSTESDKLRDRYGRDLYGSSMLMARRLVEAGVKFVAIHTESKGAGHWDSHQNNFGMLRSWLLPSLDRIYTALIDDLEQRGLLDSTLVVVMGEMGRTPRVNSKAGRDHWPQCGFSLLTGGGVKRGKVFGKTDKQGAYPVDTPVSSGDIVATIYQLMGLDPNMTVPDLSDRPIHISHGGEPIRDVIA